MPLEVRDVAAPAPTVPDEAVVVSVPADPAYFRVLRLTAAVVAGELLDVEAVEDAQIGVEEAASILLDAGPTGRIEAAFWCSNERLSVRLCSETGRFPMQLTIFAARSSRPSSTGSRSTTTPAQRRSSSTNRRERHAA